MADENVPSQALTRSDDQILPFSAWVPIGKRNYVLDLQKKQKNPIFQISMDILQNINFFRAFTASALVPAIYIQQFWNTLAYEAKTGVYSFELDESLFVLDANLLKEALEIMPGMIGLDIQFFRCYRELLQALMLIMLNLCGKSLYKLSRLFLLIRPIWAFPLRRAGKTKLTLFQDLRLGNLKFVPKGEDDEVFGMPIPNELISNNIRNASYYNAYLEIVAKHDQKVAAKKEGMKKLASAKLPKPKLAIEKSSKPAPTPKPKVTKEKPSKASTANPPKPKPVKEKSTKATPLQKAGKGKVKKVRNVKSSFQLVNEPDEEPAHSEPEPEPKHQGEGEEFDMEQATRPLLVVEGKGKAIVTKEQAAQSLLAPYTPKWRSTTDQLMRTPTTEEGSTGPSTQPLDDTSANIVRDSPSLVDAETELGEDVEKQENVEEKTVELDQDQAGSDPGETHAS
ncbi:hypothetical protein Tco_0435738 [Tanacetum coccineum]